MNECIHVYVHVYIHSFVYSFVYSFFNQSFIHSKINCEGQEHLICCKLIQYCQVDRANNHLSSCVGFAFPSNQATIYFSALAETTRGPSIKYVTLEGGGVRES